MTVPPHDDSARHANVHEAFLGWCDALEKRHLQQLTFPEVRRGLEALSTVYVQKRDRLRRGAALDGAGKRAAFAWFYGAMHFLIAQTIARGLGCATWSISHVVDLGCGTGAASAGLGLELARRPTILGVDVNPWALAEARWTWQHFALGAQARQGDLVHAATGAAHRLLLAAYVVNELPDATRQELGRAFLSAVESGARVLIIEPIALQPLPWWNDWQERMVKTGGRADEWKIDLPFPPRLRLLDKAAGLRHPAVKARSLLLGKDVGKNRGVDLPPPTS